LTGLEIYSVDYFVRLLEVKAREYADLELPPWILMASAIKAVAKRVYEDDRMLAWIADDHNRMTCQHAFMMGHGLEINIKAEVIECPEIGMKFIGDAGHSIRVLTPKKVREYLIATGQVNAIFQEKLFKMIDKLYADHLVFVQLSRDNRKALDRFFAENSNQDDRVEVPVRLR
jgi:hypothetical protein